MVNNRIAELQVKRTFKEAKLLCDLLFFKSSNDEHKRLIQKENQFYKKFMEEYYPLYLYSSLKFKNENFYLHLCEGSNKIDAQIFDYKETMIEKIQITSSSFNKNSHLSTKKLYKDGFSFPTASSVKEKDGNITQSRALRSPKSAIIEVERNLENAIIKKLSIPYENIEVLLVTFEWRFLNVVSNYLEIVTDTLKNKIRSYSRDKYLNFQEIYILDISNRIISKIY